VRSRGIPGAHGVRLTFVVSSLGCGGVERVTAHLAGGLAARGHHVTVITLADESRDFFRLPQNVSRVALGVGSGPPTAWWRLGPAIARRLAAIRQAIQAAAPEVVISRANQINVQVLIGLRSLGYPVIITEHGDRPPRRDAAGAWAWRQWLWYRLRRFSYPLAFAVVSVSHAIDRHFAWLPPQRRAVIYNPFPPVERAAPRAAIPDRPRLVSMGRLSHDKGFDILLRAFGRIAKRFPDWQLVVVGDGALRDELRGLSDELALGDQVVFAGAVSEPLATLQQAQLFVMPSRYEGFPNALGEALSCGLPVIAADCPSRPSRVWHPGGVRELVRDGVDGLLVPPEDPAALAHAMASLMADTEKRQRLASRAREVAERFAFERILDEWELLLVRAAAANGRALREEPPALVG
jgi:GalNAc-alpha-(1->4)-GalNAc-alpha-(1->3)-diNAcBac-PP-undecaprenol alpha-1,4-N-acetyl-D-galactosaminyltransferase